MAYVGVKHVECFIRCLLDSGRKAWTIEALAAHEVLDAMSSGIVIRLVPV
jgi:hypothetical protein